MDATNASPQAESVDFSCLFEAISDIIDEQKMKR
jgi:hypothetical protein